jgi:glucose/mannose-6-phosphate isomerase
MNLDDVVEFKKLDPQDMYGHIDGLPDQLQFAWKLGHELPMPTWPDVSASTPIRQVVIAGMGGSAIGGDLLAAYLEPLSRAPIFVHRDYGLPAWAAGPETLVIASSHSGNTEETLDAFGQAHTHGCCCLCISTGGKLAKAAVEVGAPTWTFEHHGQPRAAVGFSFGLLLAAFTRLELVAEPQVIAAELVGAVDAMRLQQQSLRADVPVARNPAKRMAGQLVGRYVSVLASGLLAPVARRWKGQVSEIGKAWAQFEFIPEADHNTLAGTLKPEELLSHLIVVFLQSGADHPRNALRLDFTRQVLMTEGINTDFFKSPGSSRLANQWAALHFGDFMSYYLAMAYQVDPTPVTALQKLKARLDLVK